MQTKSDSDSKAQEADASAQSDSVRMHTLAALDRSLPGDSVMIHNDRVTVFLIEELQ